MASRAIVIMGALATALAFGACGGDGDTDMTGSGGSESTGGKTGTGGSESTGGKTGTGGGTTTGGTTGTGGGTTTGGATGTGGGSEGGTAGMGGEAGFGGMGGDGVSAECVAAAAGNLVVNEVDSNGDPADWIEVLAVGESCVDVSGVKLTDTDDPNDADVYTFQDGTAIASGNYLVVERDTHFAFGLSNDGEDISLFTAAGDLIDELSTPATADDEVYARLPDGGAWAITTTKTRSAANPAP